MKRKMAVTANDVVYAADAGNASRATLRDTLSNAAVGQQIELGTFPAGTTLDGVTVFHDALGAGSGIDIGIEFPWDSSVDDFTLFGNFDTASAGTVTKPIKPVYTGKNKVKIIATVTGANASGEIVVNVDYRFSGIATY